MRFTNLRHNWESWMCHGNYRGVCQSRSNAIKYCPLVGYRVEKRKVRGSARTDVQFRPPSYFERAATSDTVAIMRHLIHPNHEQRIAWKYPLGWNLLNLNSKIYFWAAVRFCAYQLISDHSEKKRKNEKLKTALVMTGMDRRHILHSECIGWEW